MFLKRRQQTFTGDCFGDLFQHRFFQNLRQVYYPAFCDFVSQRVTKGTFLLFLDFLIFVFCFVFEPTCFNGVDELTCFGVLSCCSLLTGSTAAFLGACRYWELETRAKGGIPYVDSRPNASLLTCCLDFIPGTLRGRVRVESNSPSLTLCTRLCLVILNVLPVLIGSIGTGY